MRKKESLGYIKDSNLLYLREAQQKGSETAASSSEEDKSEFKIIGKYTPKIDGEKIVTGKAPYTHDINIKGMLCGKMLRSPYACAEILSMDLSKAQGHPGVKAVIPLKAEGGKVNYAGQEVAAVAAVDEKTAEEALDLIHVEYKPLPFAVSEEAAKAEQAPQIHEKTPNIQEFNNYSRGNVEAGFEDADITLEKTYKTAVEIHHPTETHVTLAKWEGQRLTVWDSTQGVHNVRDGLAYYLQMPASRITVIKKYMGGGFGSKLFIAAHTVAAARLAKQAGQPVKILLSRKENSLCVGNRPSSHQTYKGGVKRDGSLTALSLENYTSGGVGRGDRCAEPIVDLYQCPNVKVIENSVFTNTGASRPTRAPGHVQGTFGLECFMDELAYTLNMDPLEFRIKNYSTKNLGGTGLPYSSKELKKCYELGAEKIGWERRNKTPGAGNGKIRRGLGMASQIWWGAGVPGTLADIKIHPDGSVEVISGTQDLGGGTRTYMATITAETLGLKPQDITVKIGNSDYPWAVVSGGSLTTPSVAPAVRDAALKAADRLKQMAGNNLNVSPEDILLADGKLYDKNNPESSVSFKEIAEKLEKETVFHGERKALPEGYAYNTFGAHFAEVEIDTETGKITVTKVVAAHDSGRIMNRQTAESQVIGGVTQATSTALFEERIIDETTGNLVNPNLRDYKIATAMDWPEVIPIFVDIADPRINILGTKGLGEPPRIPTAAAIANAVFNATGIRIREIPMTPNKVLQALKQKEVGQ